MANISELSRNIKTMLSITVLTIMCSQMFGYVDCFIFDGGFNNFAATGMIQFTGDLQSPVLHATMGLIRLLRRKPYTGMRASEDTILKVSWHMHTVVVTEEEDGKLLSCEFIDTVEDGYRSTLLEQLSHETQPEELSLEEIMEIMYNCTKVKSPLTTNHKSDIFKDQLKGVEHLLLLRAIVPGTRWCGVSDIALNYHDLGFRKVDKCCRTHDYCPEFVIPLQTTYNLTNPGPFTRSHCLCEDYLKRCLMDIGNEDSQSLGNIYFNLLKIPCIEDTEEGKIFRHADVFPISESDIPETTESKDEDE